MTYEELAQGLLVINYDNSITYYLSFIYDK